MTQKGHDLRNADEITKLEDWRRNFRGGGSCIMYPIWGCTMTLLAMLSRATKSSDRKQNRRRESYKRQKQSDQFHRNSMRSGYRCALQLLCQSIAKRKEKRKKGGREKKRRCSLQMKAFTPNTSFLFSLVFPLCSFSSTLCSSSPGGSWDRVYARRVHLQDPFCASRWIDDPWDRQIRRKDLRNWRAN